MRRRRLVRRRAALARCGGAARWAHRSKRSDRSDPRGRPVASLLRARQSVRERSEAAPLVARDEQWTERLWARHRSRLQLADGRAELRESELKSRRMRSQIPHSKGAVLSSRRSREGRFALARVPSAAQGCAAQQFRSPISIRRGLHLHDIMAAMSELGHEQRLEPSPVPFWFAFRKQTIAPACRAKVHTIPHIVGVSRLRLTTPQRGRGHWNRTRTSAAVDHRSFRGQPPVSLGERYGVVAAMPTGSTGAAACSSRRS
jgi:hypothetical protein